MENGKKDSIVLLIEILKSSGWNDEQIGELISLITMSITTSITDGLIKSFSEEELKNFTEKSAGMKEKELGEFVNSEFERKFGLSIGDQTKKDMQSFVTELIKQIQASKDKKFDSIKKLINENLKN